MKRKLFATACLCIIVSLVLPLASADEAGRWYDLQRVQKGEKIYAQHCAQCHGVSGESIPSWEERNSDGTFPPPPLNGTAHTWHHPFRILAYQIKFGSPGGGGNMPAFQDKLSDEDIIDVLAWIQNLWPDEIYTVWWDIQQRSSQQ